LAVSSGSPTVTVNNTVTVVPPLAGTAGLTKAGPGTLVLAGTNTYSGATTVGNGTLKLTNSPSTGPVLYLSFDNVSGSTVVNDGSIGAAGNGLILGTGASIVAGGRYGNALSIGSGAVNAGYVWIPNPVFALNSNSTWTVAMWLKTTTTGSVYFYQGDGLWQSGNTTFHLNQGSNDLAGAFAGGVRFGQGWQSGTTPVNDGNWHFVVGTYDGSGQSVGISLYVDGAAASTTPYLNGNTLNGSTTLNIVPLQIGARDSGGGPYNGLLAEAAMFGTALTAAQVRQLQSDATSNTAVLPHFAVGGGFVTGFSVVNIGQSTAGFSLTFRDDSGNPISIPFGGGGTLSSRQVREKPAAD